MKLKVPKDKKFNHWLVPRLKMIQICTRMIHLIILMLACSLRHRPKVRLELESSSMMISKFQNGPITTTQLPKMVKSRRSWAKWASRFTIGAICSNRQRRPRRIQIVSLDLLSLRRSRRKLIWIMQLQSPRSRRRFALIESISCRNLSRCNQRKLHLPLLKKQLQQLNQPLPRLTSRHWLQRLYLRVKMSQQQLLKINNLKSFHRKKLISAIITMKRLQKHQLRIHLKWKPRISWKKSKTQPKKWKNQSTNKPTQMRKP